MKQVASLAGVSMKTVSRVINAEPSVTEATAQRVWEAIGALDYHVDMQAGSLRRSDRRTHTIGLLVSSVDNPFAGSLHRAVEDMASQRGVAVFASSLDDDPSREERAVDAFMRRRVDGLILTTVSQDVSYLSATLRRGTPLVFVDRTPPGIAADAVRSDNFAAAEKGAAHLARHGHRRIALITDRATIHTAAERERGFMSAMAAAGISREEAIVVNGIHDSADARTTVLELLERDDAPTAIFSAQNLITVGALEALRERGLSKSVALVGFDDIPLAAHIEPGVTVIAQDPYRMGTVAAERLFRRLDGESLPPEHITIPTRLIERGSGEIRREA